jgi:hypothetical protein
MLKYVDIFQDAPNIYQVIRNKPGKYTVNHKRTFVTHFVKCFDCIRVGNRVFRRVTLRRMSEKILYSKLKCRL